MAIVSGSLDSFDPRSINTRVWQSYQVRAASQSNTTSCLLCRSWTKLCTYSESLEHPYCLSYYIISEEKKEGADFSDSSPVELRITTCRGDNWPVWPVVWLRIEKAALYGCTTSMTSSWYKVSPVSKQLVMEKPSVIPGKLCTRRKLKNFNEAGWADWVWQNQTRKWEETVSACGSWNGFPGNMEGFLPSDAPGLNTTVPPLQDLSFWSWEIGSGRLGYDLFWSAWKSN